MASARWQSRGARASRNLAFGAGRSATSQKALRVYKTRPSRKKPLTAEVKLKVLTKTANETPANATHWSVRAMAKEIGISHTSVQRIWAGSGLEAAFDPQSASSPYRR
jgi:hypothetical protein